MTSEVLPDVVALAGWLVGKLEVLSLEASDVVDTIPTLSLRDEVRSADEDEDVSSLSVGSTVSETLLSLIWVF